MRYITDFFLLFFLHSLQTLILDAENKAECRYEQVTQQLALLYSMGMRIDVETSGPISADSYSQRRREVKTIVKCFLYESSRV